MTLEKYFATPSLSRTGPKRYQMSPLVPICIARVNQIPLRSSLPPTAAAGRPPPRFSCGPFLHRYSPLTRPCRFDFYANCTYLAGYEQDRRYTGCCRQWRELLRKVSATGARAHVLEGDARGSAAPTTWMCWRCQPSTRLMQGIARACSWMTSRRFDWRVYHFVWLFQRRLFCYCAPSPGSGVRCVKTEGWKFIRKPGVDGWHPSLCRWNAFIGMSP